MKTNKEGTTSTLSKPSRTISSFPKAYSTEKRNQYYIKLHIYNKVLEEGKGKSKQIGISNTSSLSSQISDSITNMSLTALFSISANLIYCICIGKNNFIGVRYQTNFRFCNNNTHVPTN